MVEVLAFGFWMFLVGRFKWADEPREWWKYVGSSAVAAALLWLVMRHAK